MKIDIHITEATPEEAALVLSGITVANACGRAAATIAQKKAEKQTGYDGDCPNCQRRQDNTCHIGPMPGCFRPKTAPTNIAADGLPTCSSSPSKEKTKADASKHHTAANQKKTRASGPMKSGRRKGNKFGIPTELAKTDKKLFDRLWQRCKAHGIMYEEALNLKPAKAGRKPKAPSEKELPKPGDYWTLAEDAAIRECPNEDMALAHFMSKFPESERTAVEVSQRWQAIRGQSDGASEGAGA